MKAVRTLQAIDEKILTDREYPHRNHLGVSLMGDNCDRRLWYIFRWVKRSNFSADLLRRFNRGHLEESRWVGWLRGIGMEVFDAGESGKLKQQLRVSDHGGHFGGTPDGIVRRVPELPPTVPAIVEYKIHSNASFKELIELGIIRSKWKHFVQMQLYMHYHKLKHALYSMVNTDTDELHMELVSYDKSVAEKQVTRAGAIIGAQMVQDVKQISTNPANFECKYCKFKNICHHSATQEIEKNCRTCAHSQPAPDGIWVCRLRFPKAWPIPQEIIRTGCINYQQGDFTDVPF